MITAAHIGVGIKGEEGVQAVNASDYSIAQFRYLSILLLKHGRYNYIRMSNLICYIFYKNVLCSLTLFWFNFRCAFSAQKPYTEAAIQLFNLFYTSVPIVLYSAMDKDVSVHNALSFPKLYTPGIKGYSFNFTIFWGWIAEAFIESILLSALPFLFMTHFDHHTGMQSSYMQAAHVCFTAVVIISNIKMLKIQVEWYWMSILVIFLSIISWVFIAWIVNLSKVIDGEFYKLWNRLLGSGMFWLTLLLVVVMISMKDLLVSSINRFYYYDPSYILQELSVYKNGHDGVDIRGEAGDSVLDINDTNNNDSNNNIKTDQASTPTVATKGIQLVEMKALP